LHQTLFYIPFDVAGIPMFGFGLLLAVWGAMSVGLLAWLARKQGFNKDTWSYVPLLLLVGAIIAWLLPLLCNDRGLPIRGYGMMLLLGVVAGTALALWRARRAGIDSDVVFTMAFWLFVPGIIGARAFYVIEYWKSEYWPAFEERGLAALLGAIVNVSQGGLVVYGAFFGGVLGLVLFVRKYRFALLALGDLIAPSLLLGLVLGRIGCTLNGCCYGAVCPHSWAVEFPWGSPAHVRQAEHGQVFLHGLKVQGDADAPPLISAVESGSEAERLGLRPKQRLVEINGRGIEKSGDAFVALLNAHKLDVTIRRSDGKFVEWVLDAPPGSGAFRVEPDEVTIRGLRVGGDAQSPPMTTGADHGSWAAVSGYGGGERIVAINGRQVPSIGQLRAALEEYAREPWIEIATADAAAVSWPVERPLPSSLRVHPTQLYDSINALVLCLLLLAWDPFRRRDGELFAIMMSVYPIARFLLERIRTDEPKMFFAGMTIGQVTSLGILTFAVGMWLYLLRRPRGTAFFDP
jgi:phosphatidylglycerol:prolipoprotein diacylglycerol transferase